MPEGEKAAGRQQGQSVRDKKSLQDMGQTASSHANNKLHLKTKEEKTIPKSSLTT